MKNSNSKKVQILKEKQNISKYTGLLCGRIFLLFCLFALLAVLQPAHHPDRNPKKYFCPFAQRNFTTHR